MTGYGPCDEQECPGAGRMSFVTKIMKVYVVAQYARELEILRNWVEVNRQIPRGPYHLAKREMGEVVCECRKI